MVNALTTILVVVKIYFCFNGDKNNKSYAFVL